MEEKTQSQEVAAKNGGPLLSDREFFLECLDENVEEVRQMQKAATEGDFLTARQLFAQYIRGSLQPELFFAIPYEKPENWITMEEETEEEAADRICENRLISCGIEYDFGKEVDWDYNPTPNQYKEWTWQLNRHNEWKLLAHVYRKTHNEKYAEACARLFQSWVRQAVCDWEAGSRETECWRTIEAGIRMGANWPYALFTFYQTPAFTDDILVDWYKSLVENARRLERRRTTGNWLVMEMNGLAHIAIEAPILKDSKHWYQVAVDVLVQELQKQIYEDGFHYELATGYHDVVINNYQRMMVMAKAFHMEIPEVFVRYLKKMCRLDVKLMMPDGTLPDLNDGSRAKVAEILERRKALFEDDEVLNWAVSEGKEGKALEETSIILPNSGFFVMRTGWDADATWVLFDGGPFGRAHQHEDKLSVTIYANHKYLLIEGGNYGYDGSPMRRYVMSTRAHNTIRVDGLEQSRLRSFRWQEDDIKKPSGLVAEVGEEFDFAEAVYEDGYGTELKEAVTDFWNFEGKLTDEERKKVDKSVSHKRSLYFFKKPEHGLKPFLLVVDRLYAKDGKEHSYELIWHLNSENPVMEEGEHRLEMKDVTVLTAGEASQMQVVSGQMEPEVQGWMSLKGSKKGAVEIPTLLCTAKAGSGCMVTVLYPHLEGEKCPIKAVLADKEVEAEKVTLQLENGECIAVALRHNNTII
ncbi:MAG: alginate lyase family protein [bacterium]|nr:alginate lyase family protein [bacterium]